MTRRDLTAAVLLVAASAPRLAAQTARFVVEEATIAQIHAEMRANRLTARALVEHYLARIAAYDQRGPALNAIVTINPAALARADELDAEFRRSGRKIRLGL